MNKMTRRTAISNLALSGSLAYAREKGTAFALIGDRYHNSDYIRTALNRTFGKEMGLAIDFCDEVKLLDEEQLRGYKLLIILRDGMLWPGGYAAPAGPAGNAPAIVSEPPLAKIESQPFYWITAAQGKAVKKFVASGGGALLSHNVTYISPHNDDFRDVLGAVTQQHPPIRSFKVKILNKEHPITRGVNDFVVTDEQHFVTYQKDHKYLLMQSVNEDGLTFRDLGTSSGRSGPQRMFQNTLYPMASGCKAPSMMPVGHNLPRATSFCPSSWPMFASNHASGPRDSAIPSSRSPDLPAFSPRMEPRQRILRNTLVTGDSNVLHEMWNAVNRSRNLLLTVRSSDGEGGRAAKGRPRAAATDALGYG